MPRFVLAPFRGLRFDPATVGALGTVISPPYDVLDADTVRDLEGANRRNIVRLILARRFERPYLAVLKRLDAWRDRGFLRPDERAAVYLYEYAADGATVRGLVGLVGLRDFADKVILPHEDVMSGLVDDRVVLMRTTRTNLEPILLVHDGSAALRALTRSISRRDPTVAFTALDGSTHRLWAVAGADDLARLSAELADTTALIADGHHRYAAYGRLQDELRDPALPPGGSPWDYGLAMLVDQGDGALRIGPIHRTIGALTMADLADLAEERTDLLEPAPDRETALASHARSHLDPGEAVFAVSDGRAWATLRTARTAPVDAAVLHQTLLPAWGVAEEQLGYHHSLDQALNNIARSPGLLVAVQPPTLAQVMDAAARGQRMPRKSTSFSPKPRMGVIMRDLRDT